MPSPFSSSQMRSTIVLESTSSFSSSMRTSEPTISSERSGESMRPSTLMASSHPSLAAPLLSCTADSSSYSASDCAYCTSVLSLMPSTSSRSEERRVGKECPV